MTTYWYLEIGKQEMLEEKGFILTRENDLGMRKFYEWTGPVFSIGFAYDRGYFDCYLYAVKVKGPGVELISLLRYLNNDLFYADDELRCANLANTLTCNQYLYLIFKNEVNIIHFFSDYHSSLIQKVEKFNRNK